VSTLVVVLLLLFVLMLVYMQIYVCFSSRNLARCAQLKFVAGLCHAVLFGNSWGSAFRGF
jgi:hypothetical protein